VNTQLLQGNRLKLLRSGTEYFPALLAAIDSAQHEIYLETYIFADDVTGQRVAAALEAAARRGVVVHLMVDGFGAKDMSPALASELKGAGVRLVVFRRKISPWTLRRKRQRRMHRKLAVVDRRIGFVGGINIIDDVNTPGHIPPRYDYAIQVEGPLLRPMYDAAARLSRWVAWASLRESWPLRRHLPVDDAIKGDQAAALVVRDNVRHRSDIEDAYLSAIQSAHTEILIANAYFFPGIRFRRALAAAARRGVAVTLLLQGRVEYLLLHYASRALYGSLLQAGVEIYEYHRSFLHAKVAVIDGRWATVGSSNIDPFSLLLAREANIVVEDRKFATELRLSLHEAMEQGAIAVRSQWLRQPWWKRLPIWVGYGLVRLLMGVFGYGGQH
jgi:cardiolipin synthase